MKTAAGGQNYYIGPLSISEIDYQNRREVQAEGIAVAKTEGKYIGRANGAGFSDRKLLDKHSGVLHELRREESIRWNAKLTGKSKPMVKKVAERAKS